MRVDIHGLVVEVQEWADAMCCRCHTLAIMSQDIRIVLVPFRYLIKWEQAVLIAVGYSIGGIRGESFVITPVYALWPKARCIAERALFVAWIRHLVWVNKFRLTFAIGGGRVNFLLRNWTGSRQHGNGAYGCSYCISRPLRIGGEMWFLNRYHGPANALSRW